MCFLKLALSWSLIVKELKKLEDIFYYNKYSLPGWSLKRRARWVFIIFFAAAFIEHVCSWISFLTDRYKQAVECEWEIGSYPYYLLSTHLKQVYLHFPVNVFTCAWAEYMNFSFTFVWNFVDIFLMLMSLTVWSYFKMISTRLELVRGKVRVVCYILTDSSIKSSFLGNARGILGKSSFTLCKRQRSSAVD